MLCAVLLTTTPSLASAATYSGTDQGKSYNITVYEDWNEIQGNFGNDSLSIKAYPDWHKLDGSIGDETFSVQYYPDWAKVDGTLPCGSISLNAYIDWKQIRGEACGNADADFMTSDEVLPALYDLTLDPIVEEFPRPVRSVVRRFLKDGIGFQ